MVVAAFIQEKALVGAFSVIMNLRMELFEALALNRSNSARARRGLTAAETPSAARRRARVVTRSSIVNTETLLLAWC